ncbi:MAG TPA: DUF6152 family protein [Gammaproteobacteria bacterium]
MNVHSSVLARICLVGTLIAGPAAAHHAFTAQYDQTKPISLTGVVVKIEWLNPHAYFYIDVEDEKTGEVVTWAAELGSPVSLVRRGWSRNSMKIGDVVQVDGILARDGSSSLNAQAVILTSTGQRLFARSPSEERSVQTESGN